MFELRTWTSVKINFTREMNRFCGRQHSLCVFYQCEGFLNLPLPIHHCSGGVGGGRGARKKDGSCAFMRQASPRPLCTGWDIKCVRCLMTGKGSCCSTATHPDSATGAAYFAISYTTSHVHLFIHSTPRRCRMSYWNYTLPWRATLIIYYAVQQTLLHNDMFYRGLIL